jgi:serine beta-lactamase-like protein LACTB
MLSRLAILALFLFGATSGFLFGPASGAPLRGHQVLRPSQVVAIRALIKSFMAAEKAPGATFAIGIGDKLAWSQGFGLADIENRVRANPESAYRTASIGKSITATAAMMLVAQGRLDLDAPIQKYCPAFPQKPWPISTRNLISHTSGIRHYEAPEVEAELYNTKHYDHVSDALELFRDDPLVQRPGADFHYSTWGYVTLGCVLEGASGEDLRGLIARLIFNRAGMRHTRDDDPRAPIASRARGYVLVGGVLRNSRMVDMSSKMGAGGWITTAPDLVRFMQASMDGKLVSKETLALMLTPYRLPRRGGTVDNFGLGWFTDLYRGERIGFYGGGTPQVSGIVLFAPACRIAIAGIFNLEEISGQKRIALAKRLLDLVERPSGSRGTGCRPANVLHDQHTGTT